MECMREREIIKIFKYMLTTPEWETIYHCTAGKPVHLKRGALASIFPIFRVNFFGHCVILLHVSTHHYLHMC